MVQKVEYDQVVLQAYAQTLYSRAEWGTYWQAAKSGFYGWLLAFFILSTIGALAPLRNNLDAAGVRARHVEPILWLFPIIGLVRGWRRGYTEGWNLRLEAQRVLCQVQIELNTRHQDKA